MKYIVCIYLIFECLKYHSCDIASSKCTEYGKAVYVLRESPTLMRTSKQSLVSECGIVSVPLIIGGSDASAKEFPHMASIGFGQSPNSKLTWDCGGSLISDIYILTAAHCLDRKKLDNPQMIRMGTINLDSSDSKVQERQIDKKIIHPGYNARSKANDIALIKMVSPVKFTAFVRPACLNTEEIIPGRKVVATGFGKTTYDAVSGSKNLMKVLLEVYANDKCSVAIKLKENMLGTMICAGQISGGKDTCQGDSGGPLQIVLENPYCMYSIIGVTSFGKFCGFENSPAIYTKVSSFVPWIESIVWKQ